MLTAMKLTGNVFGVVEYHCRDENYYYKQAKSELEDIARAVSPKIKQIAEETGFGDRKSVV